MGILNLGRYEKILMVFIVRKNILPPNQSNGMQQSTVCFYFPFKSFASLSGSCTVGMVSPSASKEKVVVIKEGDAIPVPMGLVSWWFNAGDSDTVIVFIGETSISQIQAK